MKIKAIQKLTLIDYPDKLACTLFLFGCNFRCGFCHNPELVLKEEREDLTQKEILEFLEKRKNYLEGICITGGEPLIEIDKEFLRKIKSLGYLIKIDTNGCYPDKLKELIDEELVDFISMDIKASKEKYPFVTNTQVVNFEKIEDSIRLISQLNDYEFRTTVVKGIHDAQELKKIATWLNKVTGKKPKKFCLQGFKNKGKLIENVYKMKKDVDEDYLNNLKEEIKDFFVEVEVRF